MDMCTELDQRIGVLQRLKYEFSRKNLKMLADGLVMSKLRYGISVYSQVRLQENDPQIGLIQKLQVKQNKAMRIVLKKRRIDKISTKSLLEEMGWLSVNQMSCKNILTDVWKTLEKGPDYTRQQLVGEKPNNCLLYTSPSPRDKRQSRMPSSA